MNVMFIAPHPDDIELFCGGTMLKHYFGKDRLAIIMVTSGGLGTILPWRSGKRLEQIRKNEATARYALLPGVVIEWLDVPDGGVGTTEVAAGQIQTALAKFSPDLVYLPECELSYATYHHSDHRHSGLLVEEGAKAAKGIRLRYYHTSKCDVLLDVSEYFAQNQAALSYYRSQSCCWARPPWVIPIFALWQRRVRARQGKLAKCKYAEAFREAVFKSKGE